MLLVIHVGYFFFYKILRISQGTIGYKQGRMVEYKENNKVLDVDVDICLVGRKDEASIHQVLYTRCRGVGLARLIESLNG